MTVFWSRQVFKDFDDGQETIILKHKQLGGEDLPDERQHEPLGLISFITMTTIVEFLQSGGLKINDQNIRQLLYASDLLSMTGEWNQSGAVVHSALSVLERHFVPFGVLYGMISGPGPIHGKDLLKGSSCQKDTVKGKKFLSSSNP